MKIKHLLISTIIATVLTASSVSAESITIFDSETKALQLDSVNAVNDVSGDPAVIFSFTYTNKSNETKSPLSEYYPTFFQDGVSLQNTVVMDSNYTTLFNNSVAKVQNGASVSYAVAYKLNNLTSDIGVEIKDSIIGGNTQSFTIPVTNSDTEIETEQENWEEKYNELLKQYEELEEKYNELLANK